MRINRLREKFDTDLYVSTSIDNEIELILDYKRIIAGLHSATHDWQDYLKYGMKRCEQCVSEIDGADKHKICLSNLLNFLLKFSKEFHSKFYAYKETNNVLNTLVNMFKHVQEGIDVWNELIKEMQSCEKPDS